MSIGHQTSPIRSPQIQHKVAASADIATTSPRTGQCRRSSQPAIPCLSGKFIEYLTHTGRRLEKMESERPEAKCISCRAVHGVYDLIPFYEGCKDTQHCVGSGHTPECKHANQGSEMDDYDGFGNKNFEKHEIRKLTFDEINTIDGEDASVVAEAAIRGLYVKNDRQIDCFGCKANYAIRGSRVSIQSALEQHRKDQPDCQYSKISLKGAESTPLSKEPRKQKRLNKKKHHLIKIPG